MRRVGGTRFTGGAVSKNLLQKSLDRVQNRSCRKRCLGNAIFRSFRAIMPRNVNGTRVSIADLKLDACGEFFSDNACSISVNTTWHDKNAINTRKWSQNDQS